jgi:hypothetical protein
MEAPIIRLIERCVAPAADCAVVLATYLLTDVRGPPVKATCASPISRPQVREMTLLTIYFSSDHVWTRRRGFKTTYPVLSFLLGRAAAGAQA